MNKWLLSASVMPTITLFLHLIGGGEEVHIPILKGGLSEELNAYVSIIWHTVTTMIVINSVVLFIASRRKELAQPLVWLVVAQYLSIAALFIIYGIARMGSIFIMPQWSFFIAISTVALFGLRSIKKEQAL